MNREEHLQKTFPLEDGTTYIQSIDKFNEPKGLGVGGESKKENFIDSMNRIKRFINEWNAILVVYLILMGIIIFQMWYIGEIKSELRNIKAKSNVDNTKYR
jgi:hypothetical protein